MTLDHTHDPEASSWVPGANLHSDFPIQNMPLGVFIHAGGAARVGTAIGDFVVDLSSLPIAHLISENLASALHEPRLNRLFALPASERVALRHVLFSVFSDDAWQKDVEGLLVRVEDVDLQLPVHIGDYTDFYVGIHHATNIGKLFRPDNPLLPNYKHVPIGYHGRASSVRPSGAPVVRPLGQIREGASETPSLQHSTRLDYELELGIWISGENSLGAPVPIGSAPERIAGLCLLNDWSARDVQAWEYQPLGPFLSKNFLTTVSPWVITSEALAPFRIGQTPRPRGDPQPLPYLWSSDDQAAGAFSITLNVLLSSSRMRDAQIPPMLVSRGSATDMYWTVAQMVAHHTVNGCNLLAGDLLGTGTISGPIRESFGSLMEISNGGRDVLELPTGETRRFLDDGDQVIFKASASAPGFRSIGFGTCDGEVRGRR